MSDDLMPQPGRAVDDPATRRGLNRLLRVAGLQALVGVGTKLTRADRPRGNRHYLSRGLAGLTAGSGTSV